VSDNPFGAADKLTFEDLCLEKKEPAITDGEGQTTIEIVEPVPRNGSDGKMVKIEVILWRQRNLS
jgi:hypothetical protein